MITKLTPKMKKWFAAEFNTKIEQLLKRGTVTIPSSLRGELISFRGLIGLIGTIMIIGNICVVNLFLAVMTSAGLKHLAHDNIIPNFDFMLMFILCYVIYSVIITYFIVRNFKALYHEVWLDCVAPKISRELERNLIIYKDDGVVTLEFIDEAHYYYVANAVLKTKQETMQRIFELRGLRGLMGAINEYDKPKLRVD